MRLPMWFKIMFGLFVLWASVFLYTECHAAVEYTNTDGNVTDWVEVYDSANNHTLIDAGNNQQIATSSSTSGYGRYQYSNLSLGDFSMQVKYLGNYFLGGTNDIEVGVRANGVQTSNPQMGYWFKHSIGSGTWTGASGGSAVSWGTTHTNNSCTIGAGSIIKISVAGTGSATRVTIAVGGTIYFDVENPNTVYNTGTFGIGTSTNYSSAYANWDDYLVESSAAATTMTITPTITPTYTATPTPTPTSTQSPTPTHTATITPTPGINTVTFFDDFYRDENLDGSTPDLSYSGGTWSDTDDLWRVTTSGLWHGILTEQLGVNAYLLANQYFDMNGLTGPVLYNFSFRPLQLFESGTIKKGWTFRQGDDGAYNIVVDVTDAAGTTITMRSWDAAGTTTTVATGYAPGIEPRPASVSSSLVVIDFGNTVSVYWQTFASGSTSNTATAHIFDVIVDLWDGNDRFGPFRESGSSVFSSSYVMITENYHAATPTPTSTPDPLRKVFIFDDKRRRMIYDNNRRDFIYDNERRKFRKK